MALESRGVARSRDELKMFYLHCNNAYHHQTWQDGGLPWGACTPKVTWPFDHMVLWNYVTNKINISPLPQYPRPLNLAGWWLTLRRGFYLLSHHHNAYGQQTWQGVNLLWEVTTHSIPLIPQSSGLVRSYDKFNTLYLHVH